VSNPSIVHTSDATFDKDVLKSDKPVLLDFWAEWCGPCKMIAPILDEIADQYKDKIRIAKINIDDNPATPPKFNIRGIPTLILFKNGTVEAQKVGAWTATCERLSRQSVPRRRAGQSAERRRWTGRWRTVESFESRSAQRQPQRQHQWRPSAAGRLW
jgi:thioredoxin 1